MTRTEQVEGSEGFDWDSGNLLKNWETHGVGFWECEEIFFNQPLLVADDPKRSQGEARFFALGHTNRGRLLCLVVTRGGKRIRVVSARDMSRREKEAYRHET